MGPPNEDVFMGPLVSKAHLEKVKSHIDIARKDGAHIHCGETVEKLSLADPHKKVLFIIILFHLAHFLTEATTCRDILLDQQSSPDCRILQLVCKKKSLAL